LRCGFFGDAEFLGDFAGFDASFGHVAGLRLGDTRGFTRTESDLQGHVAVIFLGLDLGRKVGMMRLFTDDGDAVPVTVVDVSNNRVTQVKTQENDGYVALQVTFGARKASRVTKPQAGHMAKAGVEAGEITQEFRVTEETAAQYPAGSSVPAAAIFTVGEKVDVQGTSIGKGFAGTIKRHNFRSQRASHGNSRSHNVPGSISMAQDPGRVFPGKKNVRPLG